MEYSRIQYELRQNPSLRLLQKDTAPLILSFLYLAFKQPSQRQIIPAAALIVHLEEYLEDLNTDQPDRYPRPAAAYLKQWCDDEHRLLRSYYESGSDDPVYELTPYAEKALGWFEDLQRTEFVGTESRLRHVFDLLEEIVGRGAADAATRLAQLDQQQAAIQREIDGIRRTGRVERLTETQIKERFLEASETARRLLSDFRAVEQNFRSIAHAVQQAQLEQGTSKGAIVDQVLDADAKLKESDQGRSFYAFWEFLRSRMHQDALRDLLATVYTMPELRELADTYPQLRRIKTSLREASDKVIQSNHRLAEQLRKLLDERNLAESRRVRELIADIKRAAIRSAAAPPDDDVFLVLEGTPELRLPLEKALWEPSAPPNFAGRPVIEAADLATDADLTALYRQFYVDETRLRDRIASLLQTQREVTLAELVVHFPIAQGLAEVLAYLQIAARDQAHRIDLELTDQIALRPADNGNTSPVQLSLPHVVYGSHKRT